VIGWRKWRTGVLDCLGQAFSAVILFRKTEVRKFILPFKRSV
jgi:hypothetical protein